VQEITSTTDLSFCLFSVLQKQLHSSLCACFCTSLLNTGQALKTNNNPAPIVEVISCSLLTIVRKQTRTLSILYVSMLFVCSSNTFAEESKTMKDGSNASQLQSCPHSPNCVSSTDADLSHRIQALNYGNSAPDIAMQALRKILLSMTTQVEIADDGKRIHAEFKSAVFGFIDDFDALLNVENARIEIRSASRTGHYDLGVNKRRVENIRQAFGRALK
jgi:uncharacterized protein (DUF1499 family)